MNKNEVKSIAYQKRISMEAVSEIFENYDEISNNIADILENFNSDMLGKIWAVFCYGVSYEQERMHTKELMSM